jgi:hypothetical protein
MQAFEPCELEKVAIGKVRARKVGGCTSAKQLVLVTFIGLIYLVMLAWLIAGGGR